MLDTIINAMAYGSLVFAAAAAYLQINKIWQRKHIADVAESVSLSGILVESIPLLFFGIYFLNKGEIVGIIDSSIWLISVAIMTMIGAGFWVPGHRKVGLWQLALGSLRRERTEVTLLARQILHPSSSRQLVDVLVDMAIVDGHLDPREIDLIQPLLDEWDLEIDWPAMANSGEISRSQRLIQARKSTVSYLAATPPPKQVSHLVDLLGLLIKADEQTTTEEELAFGEVKGMLTEYLAEGEMVADKFSVVIAPQGNEQDEALATMLDDASVQPHAGGRGYTVGHFHSRNYADIICAQFREQGFFTVVLEANGTS